MTQQEKDDTKKLIDDTITRKVRCYDLMKMISKMNHVQLKDAGYACLTHSEAMMAAFNDAEADINRMTKAHLKKYPD